MNRERAFLLERGNVATAQILEVHNGSGGPSVTVRFATAGGDEIVTRVGEAPSDQQLKPGAPIEVRYDPNAPVDRVIPVNEDEFVIDMWFYTIIGAALLALAGYGILRGCLGRL
jgi:hypothetical protein